MAEVYESIYVDLELKNDDGTSRTEVVRLRYNYTSGQSLDQGHVMMNAFDLALLIETVGAENFESLGVKLQVHLTLEGGQEKIGEIVLPDHIMKATPSQLREIGERRGDQS